MRLIRQWLAGLGLLAFACNRVPDAEPERPSASAPVSGPAFPEHLQPTVEAWARIAGANIKAVADVEHTSAAWAELDATRTAAQRMIGAASPEDRPWLLAGYIAAFWLFGVGTQWADAVLEIPPAHPVWSLESVGLFEVLDEASDPARLRAYIEEVAAIHATADLRAGMLVLELADADRRHDWPRAEALWAELQSFELADTFAAQSAEHYNPTRELRADKRVPKFCAPAIAGPDAGFAVCIDELFPHETPTLVIGWATWCGPCKRELPEVVELLRGRSLRVITIDYADNPEAAIAHLRALGVGGWTILQLTAAEQKLTAEPGNVANQPIPFMLLVDEQGTIVDGPPGLDVEALAGAI